MSKTWKQWLPDVVAVVLFALISFAYFFPADIEGKILYRHDSAAGRGAGKEISDYQKKTGEVSRWTNSTFSGMPTYQTAPAYGSTQKLDTVVKAWHLFLPENVWYVFAYLLGFYLLLRAFDFRQSLAALGSVLWAFSSYFFIIIAAGHIWKVMALAYLPPLIAGIVLAYRGKYLWGFVLTALFTAFEVYANHVQMTYYFLFVILFMIIAWLVDAIRKRRMAQFLKASAVCLAGAAIGISINISNLYHTWQYSQETMRGKSELVKKNSANQTSSGLDRDYITQWSYGIDETWTLLVPDTKGGASVPLSMNPTAMSKADPQFAEIYQQLGQYWGNQPGTSGPVYVGAFVLMLFVLGLFIVKGPMKWALLAATVLSILLSWGRNFMPFTNLFLDYVPMYAKFRTVASILVIAEFTIPLLAMMALKKITDDPSILNVKAKYFYFSFIMTGGVALCFALAPGLFFSDFISVAERQALSQIPQEYLGPLISNLTEMRKAVFTADCWRSLFVIAIGTALLLVYRAGKIKTVPMISAIFVLCLVDMWQVNKRYLNNDMFVNKSVRETPIEMTETDKQILADKSDCGDFRVLNFASDTFNENETSYFHKSIGGYHAAKLRRYQELIDAHIAPEMKKLMPVIMQAQGDMTRVSVDSIAPVLNMLNMRYMILPLQGGKTVPLKNPYAYGPAWFVDRVEYVDNANAELDGLSNHDLRHVAVADKKFKDVLGASVRQTGAPVVKINSCEPNRLTYTVNSEKGGVVVFSEVYYPGWTAKVDGRDVELGRVNYVLRALRVAPGRHTVELSFMPRSVDITETIAYSAYVILILVVLGIIYTEHKKRRN